MCSFPFNVENAYRRTSDQEELQVFDKNSLRGYNGGFGADLALHYEIGPNSEIVFKTTYSRIGDYILDLEQGYPIDNFSFRIRYLIKL